MNIRDLLFIPRPEILQEIFFGRKACSQEHILPIPGGRSSQKAIEKIQLGFYFLGLY